MEDREFVDLYRRRSDLAISETDQYPKAENSSLSYLKACSITALKKRIDQPVLLFFA